MRLFLCSWLVFFSSQLFADTFLWEVSKGNSKAYIGGTVHVLSAGDYPLPEAFEQAYRQSGILVFETDMAEVSTPAFQQRMMAASVYSDGRTLRSELSASTYSALQKHCTKVGFPLAELQLFKPGMASLILTMYDLGRLGMADAGVDSYFYQQALRDKKPLGQLETPAQQLAFIVSLGAGQEDELILSTIKEMQELPAMMTELKTAWREGDSKQLEVLGVQTMQDEFPELYQTLLVDRNQAWLPHIETMLGTPEVELILVGALHLVGEDGLLQQLSRRGYKIRQL